MNKDSREEMKTTYLVFWQAWPVVKQRVSAQVGRWNTVTNREGRPGSMVCGIHRSHTDRGEKRMLLVFFYSGGPEVCFWGMRVKGSLYKENFGVQYHRL